MPLELNTEHYQRSNIAKKGNTQNQKWQWLRTQGEKTCGSLSCLMCGVELPSVGLWEEEGVLWRWASKPEGLLPEEGMPAELINYSPACLALH